MFREITIHTEADFEGMRKAGRVAAQTLDHIAPHMKPGITTDEINTLCHEFMLANNATPATLGYGGFPKSCCTSVNHVVCHGIPGKQVLNDGDIINVDVTAIVDGYYGDTSRMYCVGNVSEPAKKLVDVTYQALMRSIEVVQPGATFGDIGHAIQSYVEPIGYSVVRDFCGHGIGKTFHAAPDVLHFGKPGEGPIIKKGMFFTIEPMINIGRPQVRVLEDEWTAITRDGSLSAQWEHTLGVTEDGYEIFTLSS